MAHRRSPLLESNWRQSLALCGLFLAGAGTAFLLVSGRDRSSTDVVAVAIFAVSLLVLSGVWAFVVCDVVWGASRRLRLRARLLVPVIVPALMALLSREVLPLLPRVIGVGVVGRVQDLTIEAGQHEAIAFRYLVDGREYANVQKVDRRVYDKTRTNDPVQVWYWAEWPALSGLEDDGGYLYYPLSMVAGAAVVFGAGLAGSIRDALRRISPTAAHEPSRGGP